MRIRYIGADASTDTFGKTFYRFKWVGIADLDAYAQTTLSQNRQFETETPIEGEAAQPIDPADPLDSDPVV